MAGLPWIELDVDMPLHPKCVRLGRRLKNPLAWAHVVQLWTHCAKFNVKGVFEGPDAEHDLASAAGWDKEPPVFVKALVDCRFLDSISGGYVVHDWEERAAPHLAKRLKDAERQRERRAKATKGIGNVHRL